MIETLLLKHIMVPFRLRGDTVNCIASDSKA